MPLTGPIPSEAMPMVYELRKSVPRPKELPHPRWENLGKDDGLVWEFKRCALGLHPNAKNSRPVWSLHFNPQLYLDGMNRSETDDAISAFWGWWDKQDDPQAAVDAVWPKKTKALA